MRALRIRQAYPTAGTPFEQTRTPLTDWFFVMFLFSALLQWSCGEGKSKVQLGVTYKTAWHARAGPSSRDIKDRW